MSLATDAIHHLYMENSQSLDTFRYHYTRSLKEALGCVGKSGLGGFDMKSLDRVHAGEQKSDLYTLMACLPPEVVYERLGADALFWTSINYPILNDIHERLVYGVSELMHLDPKKVEYARLSAHRILQEAGGLVVKLNYDMLNDMERGINIPAPMQEYALDGVKLSEKRAGEYALESVDARSSWADVGCGFAGKWGQVDWQEKEAYGIYLDAPLGIVLTYRSEPNAVMSFIAEPEKVTVHQWQGVTKKKLDGFKITDKKSSRGLAPIDWKLLLLDSVVSFSGQYGIDNFCVISGQNNRWTKPYKGEIHLPLEKALERYDRVAERLGFSQKENGNWYKTFDSI